MSDEDQVKKNGRPPQKRWPPLVPEKKCPTCNGPAVVDGPFLRCRPGQPIKRITVLRCLRLSSMKRRHHSCPLVILHEELVEHGLTFYMTTSS